MSTDALLLDDRKAENNVRTVTFCFLIVLLLLHGVGVGQGRVRAVFSSEQEKKNVECTEKISSVFMLVVLIDEENLLDKTLLQSFRRRTCVST
jgi:hypothetical protein